MICESSRWNCDRWGYLGFYIIFQVGTFNSVDSTDYRNPVSSLFFKHLFLLFFQSKAGLLYVEFIQDDKINSETV